MLTMNRATLLGHAGRNPEMRKLPSGDDVASFSLATTERFRRRDGTEGEATEWHSIVAFGASAEAVRKLVRRGVPVLIEGRIATRSWTDRSGAARRTTEIVVSGPQARVNVLAKRRREPDGDDEPPGGAAGARAEAGDRERNGGAADAAALPGDDAGGDAGPGRDAECGDTDKGGAAKDAADGSAREGSETPGTANAAAGAANETSVPAGTEPGSASAEESGDGHE